MIQSKGIGSGLNIDSLIKKLISAEGDAKTKALVNQRSSVEAKVSAFGKLKNALAALQSSLTDLKKTDTFIAGKATSGDASIISAALTGKTAGVGAFDIEVEKLAQSQRLITTGFADADTVVGEGQLTLQVGEESFTVSINANNSTLSGIKEEINSATDNTGITASLINVDDGSGGTETKLVLTANETGTENKITVTVDDADSNDVDGTGLSVFYFDVDDTGSPDQLTEINAAVDAVLYVDGQQVTSPSNSVKDAIEGVTLTLKEGKPGEHVTVDLVRDATKIKQAVHSFVDNFNSLAKAVTELSSYDKEKKQGGVLLGNATLLNISSSVSRLLTANAGSPLDAINNIVDIGITTKADGTLKLDDSKLEDTVNNHLSSLTSFFTAEQGIAKRLDNRLEDLLKKDGILAAKVDGLNGTIKGVNDSLVSLEKRLEVLEQQLTRKFNALDSLIANMRTTSSFLENQLSGQNSQRNSR